MPEIAIQTAGGTRERYPLAKARVTVGRSRESDIFLPDQWLSRHHAAIEDRGDGYDIYARRLFSNGLLPPVVRRAFRSAHPKTHRLWAVVYPFKRDAASQGNRIVVSGGLDWAIAAIHEAAANDEIAAELLRALLQDCRSDSELVQVAMAARVTCDRRLIAAVSEGLHSPRERGRARARRAPGDARHLHRRTAAG